MALSSKAPETLSSRARHRARSSEEACSSGAANIEGSRGGAFVVRGEQEGEGEGEEEGALDTCV